MKGGDLREGMLGGYPREKFLTVGDSHSYMKPLCGGGLSMTKPKT